MAHCISFLNQKYSWYNPFEKTVENGIVDFKAQSIHSHYFTVKVFVFWSIDVIKEVLSHNVWVCDSWYLPGRKTLKQQEQTVTIEYSEVQQKPKENLFLCTVKDRDMNEDTQT